MPSHTLRIERPENARRRRKATSGRGCRFLNEPILPKEAYKPDPGKVAELRWKVEETRGKKFSRDFLSPLEELRRIYTESLSKKYSVTIVSEESGNGKLDMKALRCFGNASDFGFIPIGNTYDGGEFGELARGALHTIARALGISDYRNNYYVEMLRDVAADYMNEDFEDEDMKTYWKDICESLNDIFEGENAKRLDEFWRQDAFDFNRLKAYTPQKEEEKLYEILLEGESVIRNAIDLTCQTASVLLPDSNGAGYLALENTLCIAMETITCPFLDELDNYINSDLDSGITDDTILASRSLSENLPSNEAKIEQEINYIFKLTDILREHHS